MRVRSAHVAIELGTRRSSRGGQTSVASYTSCPRQNSCRIRSHRYGAVDDWMTRRAKRALLTLCHRDHEKDIVIVGGGTIGRDRGDPRAEPSFRGTVTLIERDPSTRARRPRWRRARSASSSRPRSTSRSGRFGIDYVRRDDEHPTVGGIARHRCHRARHMFLASARRRRRSSKATTRCNARTGRRRALDHDALRARFVAATDDGAQSSLGRPAKAGSMATRSAGVQAQGARARRDVSARRAAGSTMRDDAIVAVRQADGRRFESIRGER